MRLTIGRRRERERKRKGKESEKGRQIIRGAESAAVKVKDSERKGKKKRSVGQVEPTSDRNQQLAKLAGERNSTGTSAPARSLVKCTGSLQLIKVSSRGNFAFVGIVGAYNDSGFGVAGTFASAREGRENEFFTAARVDSLRFSRLGRLKASSAEAKSRSQGHHRAVAVVSDNRVRAAREWWWLSLTAGDIGEIDGRALMIRRVKLEFRRVPPVIIFNLPLVPPRGSIRNGRLLFRRRFAIMSRPNAVGFIGVIRAPRILPMVASSLGDAFSMRQITSRLVNSTNV